ncbi:MAG TPA: CapA family protein [Spirochaetia bacterium]|nr:CapA family protein [Spirochaetia bacterium]
MIARGTLLVTRPAAVYAACADMMRTLTLALAIAAGALPVFGSPLFVHTSDDLWPEWIRLISRSPLPAGTDVVRLPPDFDPPGAIATLSLEPTGRVVDVMPLVPVVQLGDEMRSATRGDVERGAVRSLPLCAVTLPDVALPLEGVLPDQAGYPLHVNVTLRLERAEGQLLAWYSTLPAPSPLSIVWIQAVGDVMPARGVDEALLGRDGLARVFGDTLDLLRGSDLLLGNLESSASEAGPPQDKRYTFRFRPAAVGKLKEGGFSYLSLANNHTFDFGRESFLRTLAALSQWGIATSGAGADLPEASRPAVMRVGEQEVRVLAFGAFPPDSNGFDGHKVERAADSRPGILWLDDQGLAIADRAFSGTKAFTIAFVHGGQEWSVTPSPEQKRLYRELIRHGACLVIGAHPHVLEGMEAIQGNLVAYSLGNFLFPGMGGTPGGQESIILRLGVYEGKIRFVQAFPVRLSGGTVRRDADDGRIWRELMARTRALGRLSPPPSEGWQKKAREVF